jgi:iron(III) transport system permease protein
VSAGGAWSYAVLTVVLPVGGLVFQAGGVASYAAAVRDAASSIMESVWTAASAATVMLVVGLMLAYLVERSGRTRRNALDSGLLLLFAVPGTVLGVSLILFWNRPGLTGVYASVLMLLIGYVAHYVPVATRVTGVGLQALPAGIEDAARIASVPWIRMMRGVLVPMLAPALVGAWFLAFVFCLRDLDLVMTVHPPGVETFPVRVYTLMANSPGSVTAELGVVMVLLAVAVLLVAGATLAITRRISAWR